jgi:hypothetical protein
MRTRRASVLVAELIFAIAKRRRGPGAGRAAAKPEKNVHLELL